MANRKRVNRKCPVCGKYRGLRPYPAGGFRRGKEYPEACQTCRRNLNLQFKQLVKDMYDRAYDHPKVWECPRCKQEHWLRPSLAESKTPLCGECFELQKLIEREKAKETNKP